MNLNDDKDRITGDVAEKVKWAFTSNGGYKFAVGENNLYATSDGLRVGTETTNNEFYFSNNENGPYMGITLDNTLYIAGVNASMFSNTWKLVKEDDDIAKNTQIAIFKKVEDPEKVVTLELAEYYNYDLSKKDEYTLYERDFEDKVTITGAEKSDIIWSSSNENVATINAQGGLTLVGRGTTVITAIVKEEGNHDKASAKCTVIVDDSSTADLGTLALPLTVAEAKQLAETGQVEHDGTVYLTWEEGVNYYVKGKVSKVNSGLMAMFGDMDMGSIGGGEGMDFDDMMDDMDFDMDSMDDMGFDMSSLGFDMSSLFGSSDKVTYYISDDGTKDNQLKVVNGCGTVKANGSSGMDFNEMPKLSPGDCVVVCGPLVYTEDTSMFSGMMGGGDDQPKMSAKVDEMNYLAIYDPTLLVDEDKDIYVNKTLDGSVSNPLDGNGLYTIDNEFNIDAYNTEVKITQGDGTGAQAPTYKSSDEEIAKWDEDTKKIIGVNEGTAKITVKVKVIVTPDDPNTTDTNEEKSYTMKRKFKLTVKTRDLDPVGYYDGDYVLTTDANDLYDGLRLILVGTRVKDDTNTDYVMGENNSMMGGGKSGSKIEIADPDKEKIPCEDVPKGTLEVVLEQAEGGWYLKVGQDENGDDLYLYASEKKKEEGEGEGNGEGGFNFDGIMEMFNPSSGLKVATMEAATADSCKATISFDGNIATIKFPKVTDEKNNTIMLSSAFDMDSMMEMFGGQGEGEGQGEGQGSSTPSFDMGSFDMFMASFNTKKPGDEVAEEGKTPKNFMPRIYRFVSDETINISIGATEWRTIVTYKDVQVPENVEAYIVTKVTPDGNRYKANLKEVKEKQLKGGEPYMLHYTSQQDSYEMTVLTPSGPDVLEAPQTNLLEVSTRKTIGDDNNTSVYVLANKSNGIGFYRWVGGELGAGRVYLPIDDSSGNGGGSAKAFDFCNFLIETAIDNIEKPESDLKQYYNLNGQRVTKPSQKGVYIVNGKTVVVK